MSKFILDTRLSNSHYVICTEAIRRDVIEPDDLNEGRRTMAEQWHFWNNQPPLAARPSPNAPHIWLLREAHAIDSNSYNGAARRLADFYESLGIDVHFNVPGENWHFQPTSEQPLKNAASRLLLQRDNQTSRPGESEKRIKFFKHQLYVIHDPDTKKAYFAAGVGKPSEGWSPYFNDDLEKSVRRFQRDHKLRGDGVIGPNTDRAIDKAYEKAMKKRERKPAKQRAEERKAKRARGEQL